MEEVVSFPAPGMAEPSSGFEGIDRAADGGDRPPTPGEVGANQSPDPAEDFQSTSFIERYAHLFADDNQANEQPAAPPPSRPPGGGVQKPRSMGVVSPAPAAGPSSSDGDEESIEQYMSKLLQRVRGQSTGSPATSTQGMAAVPTGPLTHQPPMAGQLEGRTIDEPNPSSAGKFAWTDYSASRSKGSTPAPKTDLEALRALANESARRAISRHALRKHRRNALTKVIVSTLAGVTSLWMILESPDWRTLQAITACVSLLVAAYWAGQTFRALLEALREKADDEPEDDVAGSGAPFHSPLPIDVDNR
jgi:hypothetical protein